MPPSTPYLRQTDVLPTSDDEFSPLRTKSNLSYPSVSDYDDLPPLSFPSLETMDSLWSTTSGYSSSSGSAPFSPSTSISSSSDSSSSDHHSHTAVVSTLANTNSKEEGDLTHCLECGAPIHGGGLSNHIRNVHLHKDILEQYPNAPLWPYKWDSTRYCYDFKQISAAEAVRPKRFKFQRDKNGPFFIHPHNQTRCPLDKHRCPVRTNPIGHHPGRLTDQLSIHGASQVKKRKQNEEVQSVASTTWPVGQASLMVVATVVPYTAMPAPQQTCTFQPAIFTCTNTFTNATSSNCCEMEFALTTEQSHFADGAAFHAFIGPQALQRGGVAGTAALDSPLVFSFSTTHLLELLRLHDGMLRWRPLHGGWKECEVPVSVYAGNQVMWYDATAFHVRVADTRGAQLQPTLDPVQMDVKDLDCDLTSIYPDDASSTSSSPSSSSPSLSSTASPAGSSTPPTRQRASWPRDRSRPPAIITNRSAYGSRAADELAQAEPVHMAVADAFVKAPQLSLVSSSVDEEAMRVSSSLPAVVKHCSVRAVCGNPHQVAASAAHQAVSTHGNLTPATAEPQVNTVGPTTTAHEGNGNSCIIDTFISSKTSTPTRITNKPAAAPSMRVKARGKPKRQRGREFRPASRGRGWYVDLAAQPTTFNKVAVKSTQEAFTQPLSARRALPNTTMGISLPKRSTNAIPAQVNDALNVRSTSVPQPAALTESVLLKTQPPQSLIPAAFNYQSPSAGTLTDWNKIGSQHTGELPMSFARFTSIFRLISALLTDTNKVRDHYKVMPYPNFRSSEWMGIQAAPLSRFSIFPKMYFHEPMEQKLPNKAQIVQLGEQIQRLERERIERRDKQQRLRGLSIRHDGLNSEQQHRSPVSYKLDSPGLTEPLNEAQTAALSVRIRSDKAPLTERTLRQYSECNGELQMRSVSKPNDGLILEQQPQFPTYLHDPPGFEDSPSKAQSALWNERKRLNNAPLRYPEHFPEPLYRLECDEQQRLHSTSNQHDDLAMVRNNWIEGGDWIGNNNSIEMCSMAAISLCFVPPPVEDEQQGQHHVRWANPVSSSVSSTDSALSLHEKRRRLLRRIRARRRPLLATVQYAHQQSIREPQR